VVPRAEETVDHDRAAPAPLPSGGQDLAIDPFEEAFQRAGRPSFLIMKFIIMMIFRRPCFRQAESPGVGERPNENGPEGPRFAHAIRRSWTGI